MTNANLDWTIIKQRLSLSHYHPHPSSVHPLPPISNRAGWTHTEPIYQAS